MTDEHATYYMTMSSPQHGALGIFHAYGPEERLVACLDGRIGSREQAKIFNPLAERELRYGWLRDAGGGLLDEVLIARPVPGMRVLMTHGGQAIRERVRRLFADAGCLDAAEQAFPEGGGPLAEDPLSDPLLAGCLTEAQAAAVLEARAAGGEPPAGNLLLTHRLLLAGPPNAGKSSLLNNLAGHERALVHRQAGATTDVVDELVDLGGYAVLAGDLPGFSRSPDALARAAWDKAAQRLRLAEAVLFVCDGSRDWDRDTEAAAGEVAALLAASGAGTRVAVALNKSDLPPAVTGTPWRAHFPQARAVALCSLPQGDAADVLGGIARELFDS